MGKKFLLLVAAMLLLAACATVREPFDQYNIVYFISRAEPGFISPDNLRRQLGIRMFTDWEQVAAALQSEELDALIIGPGMSEKIEDQDALLLAHKRGLVVLFFNTYASEVRDVLRIPSITGVNWYAEPISVDEMTGDFVIATWRHTDCANGEPAYETLLKPCARSEDYGSSISSSFSSGFAGELNTDWDIDIFLRFFANLLERAAAEE